MKIYTKRGDGGETDLLGGGGRVSKDDLRVEACGAVDELNAFIGLVAAQSTRSGSSDLLQAIQRVLFRIGAALADNPATSRDGSGGGADERDVADLEAAIDAAEEELPPLRSFVLPGGSPAAATLQAARTVCRRAERRVVSLQRQQPLPDRSLGYLNRLSDLLFVLARLENQRAGVPDIEWLGREGRSG